MIRYMSKNTRQMLLDPTKHSKKLTEFSLDGNDTIYLSNLELLNVGLTSTGVFSSYNRLGGVSSIIRNMFLYDGRVELASLKESNRWLAFKNYLHENSENDSHNRHKYQNLMGFRLERDGTDYRVNPSVAQSLTTANESTTPLGCVYLPYVFPILKKLAFLHTGVFKNLRLVIEYETEQQDMVNVNNLTTFTPVEPILSVEVVTDEKVASEMTKQALNMMINYSDIEHDQFLVSALDATAANQPLLQNTNALINNFNNKMVSKMMISKEYSDKTKNINGNNVLGLGPLGSKQQFQEQYQIRVNGKDLFPNASLTGDSRILRMLTETWGESNSYTGGHQHFLMNIADDLADGRNLVGNAGYFGCEVGEVVKNLQIRYGRKVLHDTSPLKYANEALRVHVFGQVEKVLNVEGGKYEIIYRSD